MFGSNFDANFGIPTFPQGIDAQGGYLGPNAPMSGQDPISPNAAPSIGQPTAPAAPTTGPAATPALGQPSPLAGGPLSPGGGQPPQGPEASPQIAPAAGIGSPFGRPPNG